MLDLIFWGRQLFIQESKPVTWALSHLTAWKFAILSRNEISPFQLLPYPGWCGESMIVWFVAIFYSVFVWFFLFIYFLFSLPKRTFPDLGLGQQMAENSFLPWSLQMWSSIATFCDEAISHLSVCLPVIRVFFLAFKERQANLAATNPSYNGNDVVSWNFSFLLKLNEARVFVVRSIFVAYYLAITYTLWCAH